jgi:serralysin
MTVRIRYAAWTIVMFIAVAEFSGARVHAAFHLWTFSEFFSNADGSVQFIEMVSAGPSETVAAGAQIRTTSGNKVFTFPGNLSGNTQSRRLLIATAGFGSLTGAPTPDFTLPSTSFFNPAGDTIRLFSPLFGEFHSRTFTSVPTDGVMSRVYPNNTLATNSPTNFAGASGSVNLAPPAGPTGDYNGNGLVDAADYVVWRNTLNQSVAMGTGADGSGNGTIDAADYNFWRVRFGRTVPGAAAVAAVPEPATVALMLFATGALAYRPKSARFV